MADSDGIRVGDPERHRAVELLGEAMATGYLTVEEFDERTRAAYAAMDRGALRAVVQDLPIRDRLFPAVVSEPAERPVEVLDLEWKTVHRKGVWTVPARLRIEGTMGTAKLDFRSAEFPYGGVEIDVQVSWSSLKLRLGPTTRVDATGMAYSGWSSCADKAGPAEGTAGPLVVLRGSASAGSGVTLRR